MILSGLLMVALSVDPAPPPDDTSLQSQRTAFDALTERALGTASRAVRFDWRRTTVGFGVSSSIVLDLNNFSSGRVGAFARVPAGSFLIELAITRVVTWGSDSSYLLALTPYRQYGRPSRVELDINVSYPLFEGVATAKLGLVPAAQFVFSITAGLRYLYYPGSLSKMTAPQVAGALFAPNLGETEVANMEPLLLPSMQIDRGRYQVMAGLSLDVFFQPGLFVTPRVLVGIPVTTLGSGQGVGLWWELSLLAGWQL